MTTTPVLERPIVAAAGSPGLQPVARLITRLAEALTANDRVAAVLHGRALGHPLHPAAVQAPIGFLWSAAVADRAPGGDRAARALLGLSVLSSLPAAAAGVADAGRANPEHTRVATLHAGLNAVGLALTAVGWRRHRDGQGKLSTLAACAAVAAGGYVGGHLSFRMGAGANHTAGVADRLPVEWQDLGPLADLPEGRAVRRTVGEVPCVLVRHGGEVAALVDECSHLSGPLSEGEVSDGCVVCPWHGSAFDLLSGEVRGGPAVSPQPVLATLVVGGRVMARRRTG